MSAPLKQNLKCSNQEFSGLSFFDIYLITSRFLANISAYKKMVPFYGTIYKSSLYNLIIPSASCESGAKREKRRAVVFASGKTEKSESFNYKFFMDSFLCGMAPITFLKSQIFFGPVGQVRPVRQVRQPQRKQNL